MYDAAKYWNYVGPVFSILKNRNTFGKREYQCLAKSDITFCPGANRMVRRKQVKAGASCI